jgi:hypothetical protein
MVVKTMILMALNYNTNGRQMTVKTPFLRVFDHRESVFNFNYDIVLFGRLAANC